MRNLKVARGVAVGTVLGLALVACGESSGNNPVSHTGGSAGSPNSGGTKAGSGGTTTSGGTSSGGASAGAAATGGDGLPIDDRPPRPSWTPPFPLGDTGWRDSTEVFCEKHQGSLGAFQISVDSRGIFALVAEDCNVLGGIDCGKEGASLKFNSGSGWQLLFQLPPGVAMGSLSGMSLTALPDGPLLLSGALMNKLGLWTIANGAPTLGVEGNFGRPFPVARDLAYAIGEERLYRYSNGKWSADATLPQPLMGGLWADANTVVVAGSNQGVYLKTTSQAEFTLMPGVPAGDYNAVWGFGPSDLWAGNRGGQLAHYDGKSWEVVNTGVKDPSGSGVVGLWGSGGELFFRSRTQVGRVQGGSVEILLAPPLGSNPSLPQFTINDLWGLSSTEVFFTVADSEFRQYACGEHFMLWFDGSEFHPF